ncbi:MAG: MXAN_5187 C-terminal domain-containing protein [Vicinamibacterales bacterium]
MKPPVSEFERDLQRLEAQIKQLETEYNQYFAGRVARPPWETRSKVDALVKQYDRRHIRNTGERFRFQTIQARYRTLIDLWDRALRAREEGRPGPFAQRRSVPAETRPGARVMHVASFRDPTKEMDSLHQLYDSLVEARHAVGEEAVPFHKFAELVKTQVTKLQANGNEEVAFRVAVKDGKVAFTAKGMKTEK